MLGVASPPIWNRFHGKESATRQAALDKGDLIELLLAESTERQLCAELSLWNGKSYIGLALNADFRPTANPTSPLSHWPVDIENLTLKN